MPMDEARKKSLNKLHWDSRALLDALADRLPADTLARLRAASDDGEWTDLVDGLCAELVKDKVVVTPAERDALAAVLDRFQRPKDGRYAYVNDPEGTLGSLRVRAGG